MSSVNEIETLIPLAEDVINQVMSGNANPNVTIFDVTTITIAIVNRFKSNQNVTLTPAEQTDLIMMSLDAVIDTLAKLNKITADQATALKADVTTYSNLIPAFINTASFVANNPSLVQEGKYVINEVSTCCKKGCTIV